MTSRGIPAIGRYVQVHTSAWSEKVGSAGAVIFVTPQYKWGYLIVTYGGHGGTKCSEQLKQVADSVKLRLATTTPALVLPEAVIREGAALDPNRDFSLHVTSVQSAFAELADLII